MPVLIKIKLFGLSLTTFHLTEENSLILDDAALSNLDLNVKSQPYDISKIRKYITKKRLRFKTSAYFLQPFASQCGHSKVYRSNVIRYMSNICRVPAHHTVMLTLMLESPDQEIIDYLWNDRISRLVWMRVEIENAFSWLSTLGGAYSALGDYFDYCAEEAGRISFRQYKLSKMLGDEGLAARSNLYSALSLSQKGNLKLARYIVRRVADFAIKTSDRRLMKMCHGVWAKLKYLKSLKCVPVNKSKAFDNGDSN